MVVVSVSDVRDDMMVRATEPSKKGERRMQSENELTEFENESKELMRKEDVV
jgi:hypothetical protein